jgi:hypothetical protein
MAVPGELERPCTPDDAAEITASHTHIREGPKALAYAWQSRVLGALEREPWPAAAGAVHDWAAGIWSRYSPRFRPAGPYFTALPNIQIEDGGPLECSCDYAGHSIRLHASLVSRAIVLHELCHAVTWWDAHGPDFCGAMAWLWARAFRIERSHSLSIAADMGLTVNPHMPVHPVLRTRFSACACGLALTHSQRSRRRAARNTLFATIL